MFQRCCWRYVRDKEILALSLPTDSRFIGFCRQRLPTDSLLIGILSPTIFLIIWAVICYLVLRHLAQLCQLRCFVSSHSFIPIWTTYRLRWTKRMVLESLNRNRAGTRAADRMFVCCVEPLAVSQVLKLMNEHCYLCTNDEIQAIMKKITLALRKCSLK